MQDLIGRTLGHYRIVEKIGAGGMGVVYRAQDERLDREVAIKVLPEEVAKDPERLARFEREAKLLASLSHQNIATLHGIEEHEGQQFLVMELVEGETLADRIERAPIPIDDALDYARQIAEGLEAAHDQGIIHRDLKPANVMLSAEVGIKILDFGLAKAFDPPGSEPSSPQSVADSPTLTAGMTRTGVLLGTAGYMSPEQARGKAVDKRTDVWAFGCVLYEMLTRQKTFQGNDASQVMAAILRDDPEWVVLPSETPRHVRRLLKRCLVKRPHDRLHDIADARIVLGSPLGDDSRVDESISVAPSRGRWLPRLAWLLTAAVPAIVVALLLGGSDQPSAQPVIRAKIGIEPAKTVGSSVEGMTAFGQLALSRKAFALSPGGRFLVYSAGDTSSSMLHLLALNKSASVPLEGTENAWLPFFSPDSEWIGFWADDELRRVRTTGGPTETICVAEYLPGGASWGPDGSIVFDLQVQEILRVDAEGGEPEVVTTLDEGEALHILPRLLDDGETLLFSTRAEDTRDWKSSTIVAQSLSTGERSTLVTGGSDARYAPSGHLVFLRQGELVAAPFDPDRLELTGPPVVVLENVRHAVNTVSSLAATFSGQFSIANNGALAHIPGGVWPASKCAPVWVDRNGREEPLKIPPGTYFGIRISPDNKRVVISSRGDQHRQLWVFDIPRKTFSRLTLGTGDEHWPVWTPDGERIAYWTGESEDWSIHWIASDGSGESEQLTTLQGMPSSWSPDGDSLVFLHASESQLDIWLQPLEGEARPLIDSPYSETCPAVSPDGRWLAFQADYTGRSEVYVTSFPIPESRIQISAEGGASPVWAPDGRELFFRGPRKPDHSRPMMVVDATTGSIFTAGQPRQLFSGRFFLGIPNRGYDISPDGRRFLMCKSLVKDYERVGEINLTLNWFEELNRLAPPD
jgi:eukaryotic-like serine/threonine-protein kinase